MSRIRKRKKRLPKGTHVNEEDIDIGKPATFTLPNFVVIQTSPVEKYEINNMYVKVETYNSIYTFRRGH